MKFSGLFPVLVVLAFVGAATPGRAQIPATPSKRTCRNPIVDRLGPADPHVLKHDGLYYLYPSSDGQGSDVVTARSS